MYLLSIYRLRLRITLIVHKYTMATKTPAQLWIKLSPDAKTTKNDNHYNVFHDNIKSHLDNFECPVKFQLPQFNVQLS